MKLYFKHDDLLLVTFWPGGAPLDIKSNGSGRPSKKSTGPPGGKFNASPHKTLRTPAELSGGASQANALKAKNLKQYLKSLNMLSE